MSTDCALAAVSQVLKLYICWQAAHLLVGCTFIGRLCLLSACFLLACLKDALLLLNLPLDERLVQVTPTYRFPSLVYGCLVKFVRHFLCNGGSPLSADLVSVAVACYEHLWFVCFWSCCCYLS